MCGPIWSRLVPYGLFYGLVWSCMVPYGPVWTSMVLIVAQHGPIWSHMVPYVLIWSLMVLYGPIWSCIVLYGPVWSCLALHSLLWPLRLHMFAFCSTHETFAQLLCLFLAERVPLTLINTGGGGIILLHLRITFSPHPNIRWTRDQSVHSSLSVVVQ